MITVDVKDQEVLTLLHRVASGMNDMRPAMANIAQALASESEHQFATQSGPLGAWRGLADSTIEARTKSGSWPGKMLQVSAGGLAASVQTAYGSNFASIGSNKPYSAIHMFGGNAGRGHATEIAARPYLPFNPETLDLSNPAKETILEILTGYFDQMTE